VGGVVGGRGSRRVLTWPFSCPVTSYPSLLPSVSYPPSIECQYQYPSVHSMPCSHCMLSISASWSALIPLIVTKKQWRRCMITSTWLDAPKGSIHQCSKDDLWGRTLPSLDPFCGRAHRHRSRSRCVCCRVSIACWYKEMPGVGHLVAGVVSPLYVFSTVRHFRHHPS